VLKVQVIEIIYKGETEVNTILEAAKNLSRMKHTGQKYGSYDYFEHHISGVAKLVEELFTGNVNDRSLKTAIVVAYLHDIVEDTDCTLQQLNEIFLGNVTRSVKLLTKNKGEMYDDYLKRLLEADLNTYALMVKYADLTFNSRSCHVRYFKTKSKETKHMLEKYLLAKMLIKAALLKEGTCIRDVVDGF
jgi:(p)ppGpp synthase/HD superfamily hydrolase